MRIVFFGHHKCGSRFFRSSVFEPIARANGLPIMRYEFRPPVFEFYLTEEIDLFNVDFERFADLEDVVLLLSNAGRRVVERLEGLGVDYRGVHVVRDPRDLLMSAYFHHRNGHKVRHKNEWSWRKLELDRPILNRLDYEAGLQYELENITADVFDNQLRPWRQTGNVLEFKLEEFSRTPLVLDRNISLIQSFLDVATVPKIDGSRRYSNEGRQDSEGLPDTVERALESRYGDLIRELGYC